MKRLFAVLLLALSLAVPSVVRAEDAAAPAANGGIVTTGSQQGTMDKDKVKTHHKKKAKTPKQHPAKGQHKGKKGKKAAAPAGTQK